MEHSYGVRLVADSGGRMYRPYCACGWEDELVADEDMAARLAFVHATDRLPGWVDRPRRHRGPLQSEDLFDGREYDR